MNKILLTFCFALFAALGFSQDFDKISNAFSNGNVTELVPMLDAELDFSLESESHKMGRAEVEQKLRAFFLNHPPKELKVLHKGVSKREVHYMICQLTSGNEVYRLTVYLHKQGESYLIQSLEIEK